MQSHKHDNKRDLYDRHSYWDEKAYRDSKGKGESKRRERRLNTVLVKRRQTQ